MAWKFFHAFGHDISAIEKSATSGPFTCSPLILEASSEAPPPNTEALGFSSISKSEHPNSVQSKHGDDEESFAKAAGF